MNDKLRENKYIIDENGHPQPCSDVIEWAMAMRHLNKTGKSWIARDKIWPDVLVSTVFLGLDHSYLPNDPPLLYETSVFYGEDNYFEQQMDRYSTELEAKVGHLHYFAHELMRYYYFQFVSAVFILIMVYWVIFLVTH